MDRKVIEPFVHKYVKITLAPNYFKLRGTIDYLGDDSIVFTTLQKTAAISLVAILSITEVDEP